MSRYSRMFEQLERRGDAAFGGFLMLGDPDLETSAAMLDALIEGGADMIEVGIPFSDPVADGPVIQAAALRARQAGVRVDDCFDLIASFRAKHTDVPIGILTYANLVMSRAGFIHDAANAGADSLLIADVPALEAEPYVRDMHQSGIEPVLIAAANTPDKTLRKIAQLSQAYTYCISRPGVTGTHAAGSFDPTLTARLEDAGAPPPVFGFGISAPEHVRRALDVGAVGVISGSSVVQLFRDFGRSKERIVDYVSGMKSATRRA